MKVLAKFLGKVNEYNEPPALSYVTLKNVDTGEEVDTDAVSEKLKEKGITYADCEFEILVVESNGGHAAMLTKLEPKAVLPEIETQIRREVDETISGLFEQEVGDPQNFDI